MTLTDRYPLTTTRTIAAPAKTATIQSGMTFKVKHFGMVREFITVQKFLDGAGDPCWYCESVKAHRDGHNTFRRTEAWMLANLKLAAKKGKVA